MQATIYLHPELIDVVKEAAEADERPFSWIIKSALLEYFKARGVEIDLKKKPKDS